MAKAWIASGLVLVLGAAVYAGARVAEERAAEAPISTSGATAGSAIFVPVAPFSLADPEGDAKELGPNRLAYGPACIIGCSALPVDTSVQGDGAAAFDILETGLVAETPDAIVLQITVATVEKGFPALRETTATKSVGEFDVCWRPSEDSGPRCAVLDVVPYEGGESVVTSFHIFDADVCNEWSWCSWTVPGRVVYGTPGRIELTVPKAYATYDGAPLVLRELAASSGWFSTNKAIPMWHAAWTVHTTDHNHDHVGILEPANVADRTEPSADAVVLGPALPYAAGTTSLALVSAAAGSLPGADGIRDYPELDLVASDLRESGDGDLVARFEMAEIRGMPDYDLQFATLFGVREGLIYEYGVMQANGEAYGYAGRCISFGCHEGFLVKLPLDVVDGTPGTLEFRIPRDTWADVPAGAEIDLALSYTMFGELNHDVGNPGSGAYANVHSGSVVDVVYGGIPFVFTTGAEGGAAHNH